jgi:hypothetical protein
MSDATITLRAAVAPVCLRLVCSFCPSPLATVSHSLLPLPAGKDRYGMPSFNTVLKRIAQLWDTKREDLQEQVSAVGTDTGACSSCLVCVPRTCDSLC